MKKQVSKELILSYLTTLKPELVARGIDKVGLFGSYAKGSADLLSDVDILIKTTPTFIKKHRGITGFIYLDELKQKIRDNFHRNVDICDESGLKNSDIPKEVIYA